MDEHSAPTTNGARPGQYTVLVKCGRCQRRFGTATTIGEIQLSGGRAFWRPYRQARRVDKPLSWGPLRRAPRRGSQVDNRRWQSAGGIEAACRRCRLPFQSRVARLPELAARAPLECREEKWTGPRPHLEAGWFGVVLWG